MCRKTEVCTVQYTIKPHLPAFFLLPGKSLCDGVDAHRHYVFNQVCAVNTQTWLNSY